MTTLSQLVSLKCIWVNKYRICMNSRWPPNLCHIHVFVSDDIFKTN